RSRRPRDGQRPRAPGRELQRRRRSPVAHKRAPGRALAGDAVGPLKLDPAMSAHATPHDHSEELDAEVEPEESAPTAAEIDPETRARRDAALALVRKFGDPVLRTKALAVERFDSALLNEVQRMGGLMHDAMGVGLAATQLGVLHRLLVYRVQPESPIVALVNPKLEWTGREQEIMEEGCLSLPGVHVDVQRAIHV